MYLLHTDVIEARQYGAGKWEQAGYRCVLQTDYTGPSYSAGFTSTNRVGYQRKALEEMKRMLSAPDQPCRLSWNRMLLEYTQDENAPQISVEQMRVRLGNVKVAGCPC